MAVVVYIFFNEYADEFWGFFYGMITNSAAIITFIRVFCEHM